MQILYTSDTHVYPSHLDRLLKAAAILSPGAVVIGGDLVPDWRGSIAASIEPHRAWVRDRLLPRLARFREEHPAIRVLLDLGNDDIAAARRLMEDKDGTDLYLLHMRVVELGESLAIAGYMKVNPTPFLIKDNEKPDCRDDYGLQALGVRRTGSITISGYEAPSILNPADGTIEDDLDQLEEILESGRWRGYSIIFVSHSPPRNTALDMTSMGASVGSLAVRRFIEKMGKKDRLLASLHGHIHESPWRSGRAWELIGNVPCFNVGQQPHLLRALWLNTEDPLGSARLVKIDSSDEITMFDKNDWAE